MDKWVVVWTVPGDDDEITTECTTLDDFLLYIRMHKDGKIVIRSVNGMEVIPVEHVTVV
jgi:hypothetical protein